MYIVQDYSLAVIFCVVTMLCWGSWGNTQKLASKTWRYEFFYWDYVIGVLLLSLISGFTLGIMAFFYRFVAASMDMENFASPAPGKLTPYTAVFVFAIGVFVSNFLFNTLAMKHPVEGKPVSISGYFKGDMSTHLVGVLGGVIWCIGQSFSMIASEKAGAAISYGLGQGATLVSALWGILIWKEFKGAPAISNRLNVGMFILFVIGLGFLIYAGA